MFKRRRWHPTILNPTHTCYYGRNLLEPPPPPLPVIIPYKYKRNGFWHGLSTLNNQLWGRPKKAANKLMKRKSRHMVTCLVELCSLFFQHKCIEKDILCIWKYRFCLVRFHMNKQIICERLLDWTYEKHRVGYLCGLVTIAQWHCFIPTQKVEVPKSEKMVCWKFKWFGKCDNFKYD